MILEILIPVHNGEKYLSATLYSLVNQIINENNDIGIRISDNASTDKTREIALYFCNRYDFIKYERRDNNIGPDLNYLLGVKTSRAKFCWMFSDDDLVVEGGVSYVLNTILSLRKNVGCLILNCSIENIAKDKIVVKNVGRLSSNLYIDKECNIFESAALNLIGIVSTIIVRPELINTEKLIQLCGSRHIQIGIVAVVSEIASTYVLSKEVFRFRRDEEPRWLIASKNIRFYFGFLEAARYSSHGKSFVSVVILKYLFGLWKEMLVYRKKNISFKESMFEDPEIINFINSSSNSIFVNILYRLQKFVAKIVLK